VYFIGYPPPARKIGNLQFAISLSEAAEFSIREVENLRIDGVRILQSSNSRFLRALFSGGTLAYETLLGLQSFLSPIFSNSPITNSQILPDPLHSKAHTIIDLGDEFFMVGRLHPMIDNDLRIRRMKQEAADPGVGMILFDVVLGEGSHLDPAGELVPVIKEIQEKRSRELGELEFVAMVIGTDDDPQNLQSQVSQLEEAGVKVFRTAAEAVEYISLRFGARQKNEFTPVNLDQLKSPLAAINVGLASFYDSLISQGAQAAHVEWKPPAGGNEKMAALLARMKNKREN
jgi:FdrA protein